MLRLLV